MENVSNSKNIKIFRNFATEEECKTLSQIALQGFKDGWFRPGVDKQNDEVTKTTRRYTNRFDMHKFDYPQFVLDINNKIKESMGISNFPIIKGHGKDGIVITIMFEGGDVFAHKDPRSEENLITYRCNILASTAEGGGKLLVENEPIDINVGDLHCYPVSEVLHQVTQFNGDTPRIMYMFGAHIPKEKEEILL
jgi:hypothetical protein